MLIVYAYVVGDLIHKGHLEALKNAKALGDVLIVGVLTDEACMEKKPKPIMDFEERVDLIRALECVDAVVTQKQYSPVRNALNIGADILAESDSHDYVDDEYKAQLKRAGIRVVKFPYYPGHSSSGIKEKIKRRKQ